MAEMLGDRQVKHGRRWWSATTNGIFAVLVLLSIAGQCSHAPATPPVPPELVEAEAGEGQVTLTWTPSENAETYNVYLASESSVTKDTYDALRDGARIENATSPHAVTGLRNGTRYFFIVTAVNAAGESASSMEVHAVPGNAPAFAPSENTELGAGSHTFTTVSVPAGVNVTVAGDASVEVTGDTTVNGVLAGDCVALELRSGGALVVDGSISTACASGERAPGPLRLIAEGGALLGTTVSDDVVIRSGAAFVLNDTSNEPTASRGRALRPAQEDERVVINRPVRARGDVRIVHDAEVVVNAQVQAADGADAGPSESEIPFCNNFEGAGDDGGSVEIASSAGPLTVRANLVAGDGRLGGDCTANAREAGSDATAHAGAGGSGGGITLGGASIDFPQPVTLVRGSGGAGGNAVAMAGDAPDDAPCGDGFDADALGGNGGDAGALELESDTITGHGNVVDAGGVGGTGGAAIAEGGFGGACADGAGGDGGAAQAQGGRGGYGVDGSPFVIDQDAHFQGIGGDAEAVGGDGGRGGDACAPPGQGHDGGAGGGATATAGAGGPEGRDVPRAAGVPRGGGGDGGDGGDGATPGSGGEPGQGTGDPEGIPNGVAGEDGENCPLQGAQRFLDLNGFPQGTLEPADYALAVLEADGTTPTGESVSTTVRSDDEQYVMEGDVLFISEGGGLEFKVGTLSGTVASFRQTVAPDTCGGTGPVQLRGLVDNEVVARDMIDTSAGAAVMQIDAEGGFDNVYLEAIGSAACLTAESTELGVVP